MLSVVILSAVTSAHITEPLGVSAFICAQTSEKNTVGDSVSAALFFSPVFTV